MKRLHPPPWARLCLPLLVGLVPLASAAQSATSAAPALSLPDAAKTSGTLALAHFLPAIKEAAASFGLQPASDLNDIRVGEPIPVTRFDVGKLSGAVAPDSAAPFLNPVRYAWFPVSLGGKIVGIVSTACMKDGRWLPEAFGKQELAPILGVFLAKYPAPKYQVIAVYGPVTRDVFIVIQGLPYPNLTALPYEEPTARLLAAEPRKASAVLASVQADLRGSSLPNAPASSASPSVNSH